MTPISRQLTTASIHRAAGSTQPSLSPVRAVAGSPAVEPSSAQAIRRTGSNAAAAGLMSTARTGSSIRTAAQPGDVRPTTAQANAGRAAVQGNSRAARAAPIRQDQPHLPQQLRNLQQSEPQHAAARLQHPRLLSSLWQSTRQHLPRRLRLVLLHNRSEAQPKGRQQDQTDTQQTGSHGQSSQTDSPTDRLTWAAMRESSQPVWWLLPVKASCWIMSVV